MYTFLAVSSFLLGYAVLRGGLELAWSKNSVLTAIVALFFLSTQITAGVFILQTVY